nr:ABC transporter substrate-binding protein [Streptomyces sp. NBRC 110611]
MLADPDRSEALLLGVHSYTTLPDLPAVARNLAGLEKVLNDPAVWGLPSGRCTVLSQPQTGEEVLDTVQQVARRAEDTLLVYYAGHGLTDPHTDELYLALPDSDREREYTALRYEYLRRAVLDPRAGARRTVVILDCCFSGRALVGRMSAGDYLADHAMVEGTCLLTASAETRMALSPPGEKYTAFTGALVTALDEGIPDGPDPIDMNTLYRHLHRTLAAGSRPLPQQRNRNTGGLIALARNRATATAPEPTPTPSTPTSAPVPPPTPAPTPDPALTPTPTADPPPTPTPGPAPEPEPEPSAGQRFERAQAGAAVPSGGPEPLARRLARNSVVRSSAALGVAAASAALWIALSSDGGDPRTPGGGGNPSGSQVVTLGVDAPLTGDASGIGAGIRNSADLAVRQANQQKVVDGVTFKIAGFDDRAQPSAGRRNAAALAADRSVLGVVGPLNSGVAQAMQKVFDDARLAVVSPGVTSPVLTQGDGWQSGRKSRPFTSSFRTIPTDVAQGRLAARYLYDSAKKKRVFLIDDKTAYGAGLVSVFKAEFTKRGGKVVGTEHVTPLDRDFSAVAREVRSSGADLVYYGGDLVYDGGPRLAAGQLSAQLKQAGAAIPLAGGDGIHSDAYIKQAGEAGEGAFTTSFPSTEELASAKEFIRNYRKAGYKNASTLYGGYSYDAAWAIIQAVKKVVDAHDGTLPKDARAKVVKALQRTSFHGVTGNVAFDPYGDAVNQRLAMYRVKDGKWVPVSNDSNDSKGGTGGRDSNGA